MKKILILWVTAFALFFSLSTANVFAVGKDVACGNPAAPNPTCDIGLTCRAVDPKQPAVGTCQPPSIKIDRPTSDNRPIGYTDISNFISNIITIAFIIAVIVVLIMLILGAYEWIVSGGDKEAVGKARNRIINALIGLAVLAVAFALANLGAQILGFPSLTDRIIIPTPAL